MSQDVEFLPKGYSVTPASGSFRWSAPSNIALVKYWGKKEPQLPANPSISFTLDACKTVTGLDFEQRKNDGGFSFDLLFDGQPKDDFKPKIETFFKRIEAYMPFLGDYHFRISTENTFPHSSGIASSASAMAALAVNLMSLEKSMRPEMTDAHFWQKASFLARLGSGSACRSLNGEIVVWGKHAAIPGSSDLFGVEFPFATHAVFKDYQDTILLVEKGQKEVSSTLGHELMLGHPFAEQRFLQAHAHLASMSNLLQTGDLDAFVSVVESEALTLHAMMMTSNPYFILMRPNTLEIINRVWKFRRETKIPLCFTLDAGANVHLLYPENVRVEVLQFIKDELVAFCKNEEYICDRIGAGAQIF